jgi:hypothetical protein
MKKIVFPVHKYKKFAFPGQKLKRICIASAKN